MAFVNIAKQNITIGINGEKMESKTEKPSEDSKDIKVVTTAISVRQKELVDYFESYEKKHGDLLCPLCKNTNWVIATRDKGDMGPLIITLPIPTMQGRGVWAFPLYCSDCGYMIMLNTSHVSLKIKEGS
ncbi:Uncharacterised protein [Yersinia intermedia]|uniref:hypothetical protein n=1 Tax=Yersinia intermedia TaxID=631 RepID=UPI0005E33CDB|nr:hypothetical protein [Yersinia intermedia]CNJ79015.1 Uncharacterised protein [Yersinia intermedia]